MRALLVKIRADIGRRRLQSGVVILITMLASGMATYSLTLTSRADEPYNAAFERLSGAHLLLRYDAAKVTPSQLAATATLPGVTAMSDPRPMAFVPAAVGNARATVQLVGRDSPDGALDRFVLVAGRWAEHPGEMVVPHMDGPGLGGFQPSVGDRVRILTRPDAPTFTVVGEAFGMSRGIYSSDATVASVHVRSEDVAPLTDHDSYPLGYEVAYRFADAATADALNRDLAELRTVVPTAAEILPPTTWIAERTGLNWMISGFTAPLLAFAVLALIASALIITNVITGAVLASRREIGIMKAIGFSPRSVVAVMAGQMVVPAAIGAAIGIPLGIVASQPMLDGVAKGLILPSPSAIYPALDLGILAVVLVVVGVAAIIPARRAAAMNATRVISLGSGPEARTDNRTVRVLRAIPLPTPLRIGIGDTLVRPVRGFLTMGALIIGVAMMVFALGMVALTERVIAERAIFGVSHDVVAERYGSLPDAQATAPLKEQPETVAVVGVRDLSMKVPGVAEPVHATAMSGDSASLGFRPTSGRWFAGPDEAVVATVTLNEAHLGLGDFIDGTIAGRPIHLRVVGTISDFTRYDDRGIRFDWSAYQKVDPGAAPRQYYVVLQSGSDVSAYVNRVSQAAGPFLNVYVNPKVGAMGGFKLIEGFMLVPALLLLLIATVGVFNTVLLNSRERSFDHAVLKALGMSARQVMSMAAAPALGIGIVGAAIGLPLGAWLLNQLLAAMAGTGMLADPHLNTSGLGPPEYVAIAVGAIAIALAGAILPSQWASRRPAVEALRSE